ncbi:sensor histidine kinase [Humibacillus xanthopallidus]|uniref:sensor histidine kinase n=1 Tax=Humibacillus xanthopallidus TaxID=412689 RepID=UPI00384C9121
MPELLRAQRLFGNMRLRILAAMAVLLAGSAGVSLVLLRNVLVERLDVEIHTALTREVEEFRLLAGGTNPTTGSAFGGDLAAVFDLYFAREVPDEGETLLTFIDGRLYQAEADSEALTEEELSQPIDFWLSQTALREGSLNTAAGDVRYIVNPIDVGGSRGHFVAVNLPRSERAEIDDAVTTQALILAVTILIATAIGYGLAGRVLRPLRSLADTARLISDTDLSQRIPVRGQDEASRIAMAFNDMIGRLESSFGNQRRFLDEASHELRAPLTVIRGHLELLDLEDDEQERAETTKLITNEIDRMNRMVEDLLTLARAERPDFLDIGPLELSEWTHDVFRKTSVLCARDWQLVDVGQGRVVADGQRLTQAVTQLAANACQHTPPGTRVSLGSALSGQTVRVWLEDDGPGVAPEDRERIFERFARSSGGRSSGLGLSIVRAIAEAHGGSARVTDSSTGRGARFEIELPVEPRGG